MPNQTKTFNKSCLALLIFFALQSCIAHQAPSPVLGPSDSAPLQINTSNTCKFEAGAFLVTQSCLSQLIPIDPGHYHFSISVRGSNLEDDIGNKLTITLEQFDGLGKTIPVQIGYLTNTLDGSNLNGVLIPPTKGSTLSDSEFSTLTLIHRPYPADSGWIAEPVKQLRFTFEYQGQGMLWIKDLRIERTKWNLPLNKRDSCRVLNRSKVVTTPQLTVLSQGPIDQQLSWLKSSVKNNLADTYLLELSPESFIGSEIERRTLALIDYLNASQVRWGIAYHPYWTSEPQTDGSTFRISSSAAVAATAARIKSFVNHGASVVVLRADDLVPQTSKAPFSYGLVDNTDKKRFSSLAVAHLHLINKALTGLPPSVNRYFVPPWYNSFFIRNNPLLANHYFRDLTATLDPDIGIFWTGPTVRSLSIDTHELNTYRELISNHPLSLWDNTLYARRHKDFWLNKKERTHLLSYFEPYSVALPDNYLFEGRRGEDMLIMNGQLSNFSQVQIESAKDYVHAQNNFCPEDTVRKIISRRWGFAQAQELIQLDAIFWSECQGKASTSSQCEKLNSLLASLAEQG
jgi:hypothetical protein